jgi:hypothetical protein
LAKPTGSLRKGLAFCCIFKEMNLVLLLLAVVMLRPVCSQALDDDGNFEPVRIATEHENEIMINGHTINTLHDPQFDQDEFATAASSDKPAVYVIQVHSGGIESLSKHLRENYKTEFKDYVQNNAVLVEGTLELMNAIRGRPEVKWIGYLRPEHKIRDVGVSSNAPFELFATLTGKQRTNEEIDSIAEEIRRLLSAELNSPDDFAVKPIYPRNHRLTVKLGSAEDRELAQSLIAKVPTVVSVERRVGHMLLSAAGFKESLGEKSAVV